MKEKARNNKIKAGLLLSFLVFLSLSLYSYHPQDSSFNFVGISLQVSNYCGFIGASLADWLYQLFGFSCWLIVLGGLGLSYKLFFKPFSERHLYFISYFIMFLLAVSSLTELHFPQISFFDAEVTLGGAFGKLLVSLLTPLFDKIGTGVILWSAFLIFLAFYSHALFSYGFLQFPKKFLIFSISFSQKSFEKLQTTFYLIQKFALWLKNLSLSFLKLVQWKRLFLKLQGLKAIPLFFKEKLKASSNETPQDLPEEDIEEEKIRFKFKESSPESVAVEKDLEESAPAVMSVKDHQEDGEDLSQTKLLKEERTATAEKENPKSFFRKITNFSLPSLDILLPEPSSSKKINPHDVADLSKKLVDKLSQFSIKGEIKAVTTGPALVLFEFKPDDYVKVSQIRKMESDLSLALSSESVRIIAPIPGRDVVGIEASMSYRETVYLKGLLSKEEFFKARLPLVLGRRADNKAGIKDLARIPHLLVAGSTGSGKSMFIISFISSLLFRHSPEYLRLLLVDPKQVDLSGFKDVPHLLSPIISSAPLAVRALHWAIQEMERRYRSLAIFKARDQKSFNEAVRNLSRKEKEFHESQNELAEPGQTYYFEPLPLICVVIEEFGDLMADPAVRRPIENAVVRLAQKARASGIHLVLAMQSPRKDVVTGLIKTNIPGRISFKVASGTDSRIILDDTGAERLLSHGDMLFLEPGSLKPVRYHGPFMRDKEISAITSYWKSQSEPFYEEQLASSASPSQSIIGAEPAGVSFKNQEPMYDEILEFVKSCETVSTSLLQRKFQIGYPRAGRIIQILFEEGQIGPPQGSKPREVLINNKEA